MKLSIALGDEKFVNICFDKRICHGDVNSSGFVFSPFKRKVKTVDAVDMFKGLNRQNKLQKPESIFGLNII